VWAVWPREMLGNDRTAAQARGGDDPEASPMLGYWALQ
jgi:hypothetical protein